jgi:hypothetical protein
MMALKDLTTAKELDRDAMKTIAGGKRPGFDFSFDSHTTQSFTEIFSGQNALTSQANGLGQSADVYSAVVGKGNYASISGGHNSAVQGNSAVNSNGVYSL